MGLGLLPWERWLPPYVFGPLLCTISAALLLFKAPLAWWEWLLFPLGVIYGALGTWAWFSIRINIFNWYWNTD